MPFLFVDYDQGAGGEFFCSELSKSPECITLESRRVSKDRTKVIDIFNQEFLKPKPQISKLESDSTKYVLVPTHRHTSHAIQILDDVKSIRIANPTSEKYWKFLKAQQVKKVLLNIEPSSREFLGLVNILKQSAKDSNFLKKIKYGMDNLTLTLLSNGITPTEEAKNDYINQLYIDKPAEPDCNYDLIIRYEDLFVYPDQVKEKIEKTFNITITTEWLHSFRLQYDTFTKT